MKLNLEGFEIITAITTTYQEEIETYLLEEEDEVLQMEFAHIVMELCHAYADDDSIKTHNSLLFLIQNKYIKLDKIVWK